MADSIVVAVARPNVLCRAVDPTMKYTASSRPQTPDVYASANNQFRFFWSDSSGVPSPVIERICRRDITILPTSIDSSNSPVTVGANGSNDSQVVNYLHANRGASYSLVSFIQNSLDLSASASGASTITGIGGIVTNASMCNFKADTFLVIYVKSASTIACKRIYFTSATTLSQALPEIIIARDSSKSNSWVNPSIAADSGGNLCALWLRGNANTNIPTKKIIYGLYDSLFNVVTVDSFPDNTDTLGPINYYDDARSCRTPKGNSPRSRGTRAAYCCGVFKSMPQHPIQTQARFASKPMVSTSTAGSHRSPPTAGRSFFRGCIIRMIKKA